jgi:hypothetical protein
MNAVYKQTQQETLSDGRVIRVARAKASVAAPLERDPRSMNRMDPETKLIHAELVIWGRETRDRFLHGWPTSTLLGRLIEQGPNGASQSGSAPTAVSPRSQVIEACWCRLWGKGKTAIDLYYHTTDAPEAIARQMGISKRKLQYTLERARYLIAGWAAEHPGFEE